MAKGFDKVLVVGAGPSGILLALMLAQRGIKVDVVEALHEIDKRPRGVGYGPAAVEVLRRANVLHLIREKGLTPDSLTWRKIDGTPIESLSGMNRGNDKGGVIYPVEDLTRVLYEELCKEPSATVHWNHRVISVGQNETSAWADIEGGKRLEADFVVGCDGASSIVRKTLFGKNFPGKTWDKIIIGTNIRYDFKKYGWKDVSWIVHPEHFSVVCQITQDGVWRIAYGEEAGFSDEELLKRMPEKFRAVLPGDPTPDQFELLRFNPYLLHQRCAERMRVGRILLAADAAHLTNPMGGLGLTSGIADIGSLIDCLYGIYDGRASVDILDKYDQARRDVFHNVTSPISTMNLERVRKDGDSVLDSKDPFFELIAAAKKDPSIYAQFYQTEMSIGSDLTTYYDK